MVGVAELPQYEGLEASRVRDADPLEADRWLKLLPALNREGDVGELVRLLAHLLPNTARANELSLVDALAAMRDIGMFLGSIKRHGVEPVEAVAGLEECLLQLGRRTNMVPRDTVYHYAAWNPLGARERNYTENPMESRLMSSVRVVVPALGRAIELFAHIRGTSLDAYDCLDLLESLVAELKVLEWSMSLVLKEVSPVFFASEMRHYFVDIRVGGRSYLGPAAAHVPLSLVDLALWATEELDVQYAHFWRESAEFALPIWREYYAEWSKGPSLVSRLRAELEQYGPAKPPAWLRARSCHIAAALRSLVAFRGRHLRIAREAYAEDVRLFALGSGGGSVELLSHILGLTRSNAESIARVRPSDATSPRYPQGARV